MRLKPSAYLVVAISLALCGCVQMQKDVAGGAAGSKKVEVRVENGENVVPEDPVVVTRDIGAIIWNLPPQSTYLFPPDGIVLDPGHSSPCAPTEGGKRFTLLK